jgi:hypothetical protein
MGPKSDRRDGSRELIGKGAYGVGEDQLVRAANAPRGTAEEGPSEGRGAPSAQAVQGYLAHENRLALGPYGRPMPRPLCRSWMGAFSCERGPPVVFDVMGLKSDRRDGSRERIGEGA